MKQIQRYRLYLVITSISTPYLFMGAFGIIPRAGLSSPPTDLIIGLMSLFAFVASLRVLVFIGNNDKGEK